MIPRLKAITLDDFSGGLNTKSGPGALAVNEYSAAMNVYLWERGVAKRKGCSRYNGSARISTTAPGRGIYEALFTGTAQVIGTAGGLVKVKSVNSWIDITDSITLTPGLPILFCMQNNVLVGVNNSNPAFYYTGTGNCTTLTAENAPAAPGVCESYAGRLFLAQGRRLAWSPYMGDWNKDWRPDDEQYFPHDIMGLKVLGDSNASVMLVLLKKGIHTCIFDPSVGVQVGGAGTFRFDKISEQHGCASTFSVQECLMEDGSLIVIWADTDGLKAATTGLQVVKLTENIQPDWDAMYHPYLYDARGVHYKPRRWYLLTFCDGSSVTHNKVLVYDLRFQKVVGFMDWPISHFSTVNIDGVESLIGCDYDGYWNQYDTGQNDNGSAINSYFVTRVLNDGLPFTDKGFKSVGFEYALLGNWGIAVMTFFDDSSVVGNTLTHIPVGAALGSFVLDQDVLASDATLAMASEEIFGRGKSVQLHVSNALADEPFRIHKLHLTYQAGRTSPLI